ncbi:MAG: hypothetical protein Crog4KO_26930 [Crocinitomicaceae bacterium]
MKLEKYIARLYRFSFMKEVGKTGALALGIVALTGIFTAVFLPSTNDLVAQQEDKGTSYLTLDATHVKNDDVYFHEFMKRLKKNDDVLVLGTSESGFMDSYNYWELLNADAELEEQFGVLYGAGRSCERYIPSMLNNPEIWQKQQLLVIVNPVYWRESLSKFNTEYHARYMNDAELQKARIKSMRKEDFDLLFGGGQKGIIKEQMANANQFIDREIHELYYGRLHAFLGLEREEVKHFTNHLDYLEVQNRLEPKMLNNLRTEILPDFNCTQEFIDKGDYSMLPLILDAEYRNTSLDYFMDLCKQLEMDVTFVLGPYNQILAAKCGQPEIIEQHEILEDRLREKFKKEGFECIDATDISEIPGSFIDKQHHSKYGGYLLYKRIKDNWHE